MRSGGSLELILREMYEPRSDEALATLVTVVEEAEKAVEGAVE